MHKRNKHIETKFHFIRDKTEDGTISIPYLPTDKMAADIFTKSLPVSRLHWFRRQRIKREEGKVTVDKERYIETRLERFQMDQSKHSRTPVNLNLKFQTAQNRDEEVDQKIYRSLVGSLLYLAKQTRPDFMFTVNILSRHMNTPTNQHWMCGKRLLRYLQGSKGFKLTYTKEPSYDLVGESDAY